MAGAGVLFSRSQVPTPPRVWNPKPPFVLGHVHGPRILLGGAEHIGPVLAAGRHYLLRLSG